MNIKNTLLSVILLSVAAIPAVAQQDTRTALLHMKSGEIKEFNVSDLDSITFSAPVNYDKVVQGKYGVGAYWGKGQYLTILSTDPLTEDGLPTKVGQISVGFYAIGEKPLTAANAILPSGRYVSSSSLGNNTLYDNEKYLYFFVCTEIKADGAYGYSVYTDKGAEVNVEYKSNGTYTIDFKGRSTKSDKADFANIHMTFDGKINYINKDNSYYENYDHDVAFQPTGSSAGFSSGEKYSSYSCAFYTTPIDSDGFIVGAGELVNIELLTAPSKTMNLDDLIGSYEITDPIAGPWKPGTYLAGTNYDYGGFTVSIGTFINEYDSKGNTTVNKGYVTGGTLEISKNSDGKYRFLCDFTMEGGHKLTMDYAAAPTTFVPRSVAPKNMPMIQPRNNASARNGFMAMPTMPLSR
ncbi:MAG: hypothetical protein SOZ80_03725 [Prevotella sp.]|uniref:hypothetical protein n=1 Tax=Prevotella sp. TaxID=59823 RepID=UPI002A307251|nr:hypothetical protein [Prevotella sp.]MDD7317266.1 hypothetical protein [Prevotellaceae bacterium]MDY4019870.1 hypothetical protein [Prevotella sp.]